MKIEPLSSKQSHFNVVKWRKNKRVFKAIWKSRNVPSVWITVVKYLKHTTYFFYKIIRPKVQNKLQCTFGGKFSVFGYSYPNTGINKSELANESRYFIKLHSLTSPTYFCTSSEPMTRIKQASVRLATARAQRVLPVPGGPNSSTPFGGSIPRFTNRSG